MDYGKNWKNQALFLCGQIYPKLMDEWGVDFTPSEILSAAKVDYKDDWEGCIAFLRLMLLDQRVRFCWLQSFCFDLKRPAPARCKHNVAAIFLAGMATGWVACVLTEVFRWITLR